MEPRRPSLLIVTAGIFALVLIGFSVWFTTREPTAEELTEAAQSDLLKTIRPIQVDDHVYGNPNAPITFIVYTDFSCPYCKEYHTVITGIIDQYGKDGAVSLVYRNIPFVQLHPDAPMYAHAAECVASIGGNNAYWAYVQLFFKKYTDPNRPGPDDLVAYVEELGLSGSTFRDCMRSNRFMDRIETDYREATGVEAAASPFTVVIEPDMRRSFEGAREFVDIAGALISSIQTFEETGLLPLKKEPELPAVPATQNMIEENLATTSDNTLDPTGANDQDLTLP